MQNNKRTSNRGVLSEKKRKLKEVEVSRASTGKTER